MTNQNALRTAAIGYSASGFATLPVKNNKRPSVDSWTHFQHTKASDNEIQQWFRNPESTGLAIIAGKVSGNIEVLDVDCKYDLTGSMMKDFCDLLKEHLPELFPKLVIAKTVNKGFHVLFRVPAESIEGNKKLASRPATSEELTSGDKVKVLFETRGEGGYFVAAPTEGYGLAQGSFEDIPLITAKERDTIFTIARSFDQMPIPLSPEEKTGIKTYPVIGLLPFDDYNVRGDVPSLLEQEGWRFVYKRGDRIYYKRPGTTDSFTSANFHTELRVFYVFSTSTEFEGNRGYNPVQVYTQLKHNGDFSAASKALYAEGYGTRRTEQNIDEEPPTPDEWLSEPKPLDLTLKPVETIDDDCLPKVLVDWLRPASKVIGCPFDFLVLSAIVIAATLIGARLRVKPLKNSDWFVVSSLYAGLVGLPSTKKTPALDETRKPLLELQQKARKEYETAKKDYEIEARFFEKESTKHLKDSKTAEDYKLKLASITKPEQPTQRRFETNDITASKLIQFLSENPIGMMLFRDELTGWLKSLEAEYDKSARPFFLELWKGAISYELSRVDGREIQLSSGTLSIVGGVQPSKLQRLVTEAYSFDNSDGFLQRFLFAYPDAYKRTEKPTESDYRAMQKGFSEANETLKRLADFDFQGRVIGANGDQFHVVKFDSEAQITVDQWKDEIEAEAESLQIEDEAFSSFLYKQPKNCFAIALIFHCLENIEQASFPDEISNVTVLKAVAYTQVLLSHARRVFALGENQIFALAQTLIGKIKKGELQQGFTQREIARKQWSGLKTPDTLKDVLSLLLDYGYLKQIEKHGEGRPTVKYFIHPSLIKEVENED
jgi:putative DNA primase/helicase